MASNKSRFWPLFLIFREILVIFSDWHSLLVALSFADSPYLFLCVADTVVQMNHVQSVGDISLTFYSQPAWLFDHPIDSVCFMFYCLMVMKVNMLEVWGLLFVTNQSKIRIRSPLLLLRVDTKREKKSRGNANTNEFYVWPKEIWKWGMNWVAQFPIYSSSTFRSMLTLSFCNWPIHKWTFNETNKQIKNWCIPSNPKQSDKMLAPMDFNRWRQMAANKPNEWIQIACNQFSSVFQSLVDAYQTFNGL